MVYEGKLCQSDKLPMISDTANGCLFVSDLFFTRGQRLSKLAHLFTQPSSAMGGQKQRSLLGSLHFTRFLVPSFCEKNGQIGGSGKTQGFFLCPYKSRQARCFLVKAVLSLVAVGRQSFFRYCALLRITFPLFPFIHAR